METTMNRRLKPIFLMAPPEESGESGEPTPAAGSAEAPRSAGEEPADDSKTFTQADIDRIIAGRLSKFADYDQIKAKLGEVEAANQTETEKAINAAKVEARQAALAETGPRLVSAEFRAALAGRRTAEEVASLIEDFDLSKYLTDTGEVDTKRVAEKADLLAPKEEQRKTAASFGGGAQKSAAGKAEVAPGLSRMRQAYADADATK